MSVELAALVEGIVSAKNEHFLLPTDAYSAGHMSCELCRRNMQTPLDKWITTVEEEEENKNTTERYVNNGSTANVMHT